MMPAFDFPDQVICKNRIDEIVNAAVVVCSLSGRLTALYTPGYGFDSH